VLLTVFFSGCRIWHHCYIPQGQSMMTSSFINSVLVPLRDALDDDDFFGGCEIKLHCDNASCHRSKATREAYEKLGFKEVSHPPYSPDISPADFYLFGHLKSFLRGQTLRSLEHLKAVVDSFLADITPDLLQRVFYAWMRRCSLVISLGGEYVRKHML
jgi:hypothetical protein